MGKVIIVNFSAKHKKKNNHNNFTAKLFNWFRNLFSTHNKYNKISKEERYRHKSIY